MQKTNWKDIEAFTDPNEAYKAFLEKFLFLYDKYFPIRKIKIKAKDLESPRTTNGIKKSSKKRQCLYQKFKKKYRKKTSLSIKTIKSYLNQLRNIKKNSIFLD